LLRISVIKICGSGTGARGGGGGVPDRQIDDVGTLRIGALDGARNPAGASLRRDESGTFGRSGLSVPRTQQSIPFLDFAGVTRSR
jgi:hypothetical protein